MSRRTRSIVIGAVAIAAAVAAGGASAAPIQIRPKAVATSRGTVTVNITGRTSPLAHEVVTFSGTLAEHGWSYTGTLSGATDADQAELASGGIPNFAIASADVAVTGNCGASPGNSLDGGVSASLLSGAVGPSQMLFDCVLTHNCRWFVPPPPSHMATSSSRTRPTEAALSTARSASRGTSSSAT